MAVATLIIGGSGGGKSRSLKHLDASKSLLIQPRKKSLPFKSQEWKRSFNAQDTSGSLYVSNNYQMIHNAIVAAVDAGKRVIILDDANYLMQNEFLETAEIKGYDKYTTMCKNYVDLFEHLISLPDDVRVYIMTHGEMCDDGITRSKTIGKMANEKICLEGLFTVVLSCYKRDGVHYFGTTSNGGDVIKSPEDMFSSNEIENDLSAVDAAICEYEGITDETK